MINFISKYFNAILVFFCALIILPFLTACLYIHPFFDDYFFAEKITNEGAFQFVKYFYLNWSGRYSEELLMVLFNAKIIGTSNLQNACFGIFIIISLIVAFSCIVNVLFEHFISRISRVAVVLTAFSFYLAFLPEVFTSFYWYCSSYYQLSLTFSLINIALIIGMFTKQRSLFYKIGIVLLNILIAGFSEITIITFILVYSAIVLNRFINDKKVVTFWSILLLVFGVFALLNIFSPGTFARMGVTKAENSILFASLRSMYDLIIFQFGYTLFKTPFLFLCILFTPQIINFVKSGLPVTTIFKVNPIFSIGVTLLLFYLQHLLTLYGAGYSLQGRVFNFSILFFWFGLLYNYMICIYYYSDRINMIINFVSIHTWKFALLLIVFLLNFSDNNRLLLGDLTRELPKFQRQLKNRYERIEEAKKNGQFEVEVPPVTAMPKLYIFVEEAKCSKVSFTNEQKYLEEAGKYFDIKIKIN